MARPKFQKSKQLLRRALEVTPCGAQTYSKSYRYFSGQETPYFLARGSQGHVWDVDGNEFVDFILGLGAVTVGYNHPEINAALRDQLKKGISFSQSTPLEVELAEKLIKVIPCAEMVRFVKNGSDATSVGVRLARAYTGREMVAVCGYHGMHDWYIGSTENSRGVPQCVQDLVVKFNYNDLASLEEVFARHPGKIAAVILEPVQGNGPADNYLQALKELTHRHNSVLIFDEVVSGFRIALGGAQEYYGVVPDLAAVGKGMANGLAVSALVGKRELLKLIEERAFISTTFGGECLSLAGAIKTVEILSRPGVFKKIWKKTTRLQKAAREIIRGEKLETVISVWGLAPHFGFAFQDAGKISSAELQSLFQQILIREGILTVGVNNSCVAHTAKDIDRHLQAVAKAAQVFRRAIDKGTMAGILQQPLIEPIFKRR